jgi:Uri superfamily endonuclease
MSGSSKGSYTLIIKLSKSQEIKAGSLGEIFFQKGFYAYNGSAFGPGGLKRVERHREKSSEGGSPHWHIDYLLVQKSTEIVNVFRKESDHECDLSQEMKESFGAVKKFGCSDCSCNSHLFYCEDRAEIESFLEKFYA